MAISRRLLVGGGLAVTFGALAVAQAALQADSAQVQAPRFEVDPFWPKPLPNHQILGSVIGVAVDSRDHVFIIHRGDSTLNARTERGADATPPMAECCRSAPPVLEFDPAGNLVRAWGGPGAGYEWPSSNHGIAVDHLDNIWIGGNGRADSHVLKFTRDGKFLLQIGKVNQEAPGSLDSTRFGRVAKIAFDSKANEAYLADGYLNRRVAVIDMNSGRMKRFWGAYGETPSDAGFDRYDPDVPLIRQFRNPVHCADPSNDGFVYVCDRVNNRLQVFRKDGMFVSEVRIAPRTLGDGAVWDVAFSRDPEQRWIYIADGRNEKIYVMERKTLQIVTAFGDGGRQPGQFFAVHSIATDSKGNIYTTETYEGKRLQKFVYKGVGNVSRNQGTVWPR